MSASEAVALHTASAHYPGSAEQLSAVRASLRGLLHGCPLADDAILCASELAANAILHSRSGQPGGLVTVRTVIRPGQYVQIDLQDDGGPWPLAARDPVRGHGLDIIHALAADWGIDGDYRARTVWIRLDWPTTTQRCPDAFLSTRGPGCDSGRLPDPSTAHAIAQVRNMHGARQWTPVIDGPRLRRLRQLHGLSQERLAYQADLSIATVANLERPPQRPCRWPTLARLATALEEHPAAIIRTLTPPPRT
jgi:serine/threonine-protein kinase RsbW